MKKILLPLLIMPLLIPIESQAASEDECAIWLCLPTGFPDGCSSAKSAFIKRVKKLKPPLPDFFSCMVTNNNIPPDIAEEMPPQSEMTTKYGTAAYIPARRYCIRYSNNRCYQYETKPASILKDRVCRIDKDRKSYPNGCTSTIKYVDTYMDNNQYGQTYYFTHSGEAVNIGQ